MNDTDTGPPRAQRFAHIYEQTYAALLRFVERRVHPSHAENVVKSVTTILQDGSRHSVSLRSSPAGRARSRAHLPRAAP
ncbi:hypothetical protein AB0O28_06740 [Microbispora sp. NPDC088329]|uniref:hypothetical protein n=1 Tax=Microbispora sp. NPDC088329 TaxID=3154869 RepID=UPI003435D14E